jgi:hypothetical protein
VLSFGYNAHFAAAGSNIFDISDFAKELLFGMKFGMDKQSKLLGVGQVSINLLLCPVVFEAYMYCLRTFGSTLGLWLYTVQSLFTLYEALKTPTRILEARIVGRRMQRREA